MSSAFRKTTRGMFTGDEALMFEGMTEMGFAFEGDPSEPFRAVGDWYDDFTQVGDMEVRRLLGLGDSPD